MKENIVSVVVPIYNVELYMRKCIDTIISQTYKELEIILVDDGSTDTSGKIADEYKNKDSRIQVIHKTNGGLSDARNKGMKVAKGKYICFIDSDDYIEKNMIENMVKQIQKTNSDVVICGFYVDYEDKSGKLIRREARQLEGKIDLEKMNPTFLGMLGYAWNKIYSLNFLRKNNFEFEKGLSMIEDTEFNTRVLSKANIALNQGIYNHYVQRPRETLGNKKYDNFLELIIRYCKCREVLLKKWNVEEKKIQELKRIYFLSSVKRYVKIITSYDKATFKDSVNKLYKNDEIKRVLINKENKSFKDKIFCFLLKHKMFLALKIYYKNRN